MKITLLTGQTFDLSTNFGFNIKIKKTTLAKRLTLRIDEKNHIPVLTIPNCCSKNKAIAFIKEHLDWINTNLEKLPPLKKFTNNDKISLMGKEITIIHDPTQRGISLTEDKLITGGHEEFLHRRVCDFIKKHAQKELYQTSINTAKKLNCEIHNVFIKDTKSRWGSCSNKKNINYNWRIALAPQFVIDYLVCHEVSHLVHQDHSPLFWKCVSKLCPKYKEARQWLKTLGKTLYQYE